MLVLPAEPSLECTRAAAWRCWAAAEDDGAGQDTEVGYCRLLSFLTEEGGQVT